MPENSASYPLYAAYRTISVSKCGWLQKALRSTCRASLPASAQPIRHQKPIANILSRPHQRLPSNRSIRPAPPSDHCCTTHSLPRSSSDRVLTFCRRNLRTIRFRCARDSLD